MDDSNMGSVKQTMGILSNFLNNVKRTLEQLCEGHTLASVQASKQRENVAASAFGMRPALEKVMPPQNAMKNSSFGRISDQNQSWSYSSQSNAINGKCAERRSDHRNEINQSFIQRLPDSEMECAVGFFLNDMKKTVDSWFNRYSMLSEGKAPFDSRSQLLHTGVQVLEQFNFGPEADHVHSVMREMDDRDNEVLLPYPQGGQIIGRPFFKKVEATNRVANRKSSNSRANRRKPKSSVYASQGITGNLNATQGLDLTQHMILPTQDTISSIEYRVPDSNGHLGNTSQNDSEIGVDNIERAIVKFTPLGTGEKSLDNIRPPVQTDELTIRPHHHKVEIVESPSWLPKGWITEVKTRISGGSAGCKDKYYYDPVSKRRCRSQKEVFCFLETGKLGRYKRKQPSTNKSLSLDLEKQASKPSEVQTTEKDVSSMRKSPQPYNQENTSGAFAIFPSATQRGWGGGTFLPYRAGQTNDFLYDNLANMSRPGFDQFNSINPPPNKPTDDRGISPSRPWLFSSTEFPTGGPVSRIEVENVQGFTRSRRGIEGTQKRPKKSSKQ
ncbi:hypothetical protein KP509_38G020300 [Ceratopteris richardii]|uniref:MBD domain-containing protein n=1 Tax=Ceratopteris richardii TaxID=49495 RepID=A0A8T2Q2X7_CERRI|nr:hypothetical protein KP509_38G020300 [Ceratopteris richardii]